MKVKNFDKKSLFYESNRKSWSRESFVYIRLYSSIFVYIRLLLDIYYIYYFLLWCHSEHCKRVNDHFSKHVSQAPHFGDAPWPPRSPDLSTCIFFLWGYLKSRVYTHKPRMLNNLKEAICQEIRSDRSSVVGPCRGRFLKKAWKLHPRRRSASYWYHF